MKKLLWILSVLVIMLSFTACAEKTVEPEPEVKDYTGTYIGYSWHGESKETSFEDATQKIETTLELDKDGTILDAKVLFWKKSGDHWYSRQDGTSRVSVDMNKTPEAVTLGETYKKGVSMFDIDTHDLMSFYAAKTDADGTTALVIVEPISRYQYEIKMSADFDFNVKLKEVTIDGTKDGFIPTYRASSSGLVKLKSLEELSGKNLFNVHEYFNVISKRGVFKGINGESTMQQLLEAAGIKFAGNMPQESELIKGFHSNGGWAGNYKEIEKYLIGKNAVQMTSLVDWSVDRWSKAVNDENFFGVDVVAGATKTAQNSADTISGATVRMSRESTSYQRALVEAGILEEKDVIKGRF